MLILLLGIGAAALLYGLRSRSPDPRNDPALASYYREQSRQAAIVYGGMGPAAVELWDALKRPGTQAIMIVAVSVLTACGCFFFARLSDEAVQRQ